MFDFEITSVPAEAEKWSAVRQSPQGWVVFWLTRLECTLRDPLAGIWYNSTVWRDKIWDFQGYWDPESDAHIQPSPSYRVKIFRLNEWEILGRNCYVWIAERECLGKNRTIRIVGWDLSSENCQVIIVGCELLSEECGVGIVEWQLWGK